MMLEAKYESRGSMLLDGRNRLRGQARALDLPPPFRLVALREAGDAFAHAQAIAPDAGAGTLVQVGRFDLAEFAVVLEPDEPLRAARRAFYAGCVALADALIAHAPPEKAIAVDWPDAVRVDGGLVGGARLAWPEDCGEDARPDWLVFGAVIRTVSLGAGEPGLNPLAAALEDEGFDELGSDRLVESFARHLMVALDEWQERGFDPIARRYLERLTGLAGELRSIDAAGDLLVRRAGAREAARRSLVDALGRAAWLDPETGGPRR
jgi:biotin-(acetyl-CoA carboxylase) ligase